MNGTKSREGNRDSEKGFAEKDRKVPGDQSEQAAAGIDWRDRNWAEGALNLLYC